MGRIAFSRKIVHFGGREEGSMTLEASILFPWVLILTLMLVFFSVTVTENVLLHYSASVTAERAAFAWPHSASDFRTGAYPGGGYDDLYWRLKDDALLAGLFGLPAGQTGASPLTREKLVKATQALPGGIDGTFDYRNRLWTREIYVQASGGIPVDPMRRLQGFPERNQTVYATAAVTEPAEWIRTFNLVRYYRARMNKSVPGASAYREQAAAVLERKR